MKLTQKLTILFESKIPSGNFKFIKAIGKEGEIEASKEIKGSTGSFKKGPHQGLDFINDGSEDNIFMGKAVVKQTGNKLEITDNYGSVYHFQKR